MPSSFLAGFGPALAESIQQGQENAYKRQLMQMRQMQLQQELQDRQRQEQAAGMLFGALASMPQQGGGMQPMQQLPQTAGMSPVRSGQSVGGGLAAGGAMTGDPLDLIAKYESGGRNIMQQAVPPGGGYNPSVGRVTGPSTAQGPWQITNTTWRAAAPKAGVDINQFPTAMSAPVDVQRQVARTLFGEQGFKPWAPYNPRLAAAIRGGDAQRPAAMPAAAAGGGAPDAIVATDAQQQGGTMPAEQQSPVPAPLQQEAMQTARSVAPSIPQGAFGTMDLRSMAQLIEQKAGPDASPVVKMMALEKLQNFLAPQQKMAFEMVKEQNHLAMQKELAQFTASLPRREASQLLEKDGQLVEWHPGTPIPQGARRTGAFSAAGQREMDIEGEIKRLDTEWGAANPDASPADKQKAHFENRRLAEQNLAESRSTPRSAPAMIMQQAKREHPEWTSTELANFSNNYVQNQSLARAFGGGMNGRNVIALNTVADHILRVEEYAEALKNGDIPRANQVANSISAELGKPEVTTFEAGRDIMSDEIVRLLTSTGGTEADRKGMQSRLATMFSPEQFAGVFEVFKDMTGARFKALEQAYSRGDKGRATEFQQQLLTPDARSVLLSVTSPRKALEASSGGRPATPEAKGAAAAYSQPEDVLRAVDQGTLQPEAAKKILIDKFGYKPQ